jgi:Putative bacterial sensory transduction regulator
MISFESTAQELTYRKVAEYLESSMFQNSMRVDQNLPKFDLLYQGSTLIEVEVLPWEIHPWNDVELAIVRATSCVTIGSNHQANLMQYLLAENNRMRFGAFQLDESGQVLFTHSILGGSNMDLLELQTCILSVATIASTYDDIITEQFGGSKAIDRRPVEI